MTNSNDNQQIRTENTGKGIQVSFRPLHPVQMVLSDFIIYTLFGCFFAYIFFDGSLLAVLIIAFLGTYSTLLDVYRPREYVLFFDTD